MAGTPDLGAEIADAIKRGDELACEQAAARAHGYSSTEHAVVDTLEQLMRPARRHADHGQFKLARERWLHRAAMRDQRWARDRVGLEWATSSDPDEPSPYWPYRGWRYEGPPPDHAVSAEQARGWLVSAARRGDRNAAYWAGLMDRDDVESLLAAYSSGTADKVLDESQLCATAARLAEHYRRSDSADDAGHWFRTALEGPKWEEYDSRDTSVLALANYIEWAHSRDDTLCAMLCRLMIDDAVLDGPRDRMDIAEEAHKPLRLDYGRADNNERARAEALRHIVDEHCHNTSRRAQVLLVLAENHYFGRDGDRERVSRILAEQRGAPLDLTEIENIAWDFVAVLLRQVIPSLLRSIRCDCEATEFEAALLPVSFSPAEHLHVPPPPIDYYDYLDSASTVDAARDAHFELSRLISSFGGDLHRLLKDTLASATNPLTECWGHSYHVAGTERDMALSLLAQIGFGSSVYKQPDGGEIRLFRGTAAWLAMWLATSTELPEGLVRAHDWSYTWLEVSDLMLVAARTVVRHEWGLTEQQDRSDPLRNHRTRRQTIPIIEATLDALQRQLSPR